MKHSDEFHGRHFDLKLLWRFLPFIRPYRRSALYGFALLPFISLLRVVPPLLIKEAIDNNIVPGNLAGLLPIAATLIGLLLVEGALVYWQALNVQLVGQRIMADLRRDGFAKLMRVPRSWYDWQPAGRLLTRLTTDIEQVGDLFGSGIVSAIGDVATLLLIFAIMLSINTPLSLVAFAVVPVLVVAILLIRRPMRTVMRQLRSRLAALNAFVSERVSGIAKSRFSASNSRPLMLLKPCNGSINAARCRGSVMKLFFMPVSIFSAVSRSLPSCGKAAAR